MNTPIGKSTLGEMLPSFIFLFILLSLLFLLIILCFKMIISTAKTSKTKNRKIAAMRNYGMTIYAYFRHVQGLPLAESVACEVYSYPDRLEIRSDSIHFSLSKDKIISMITSTDYDIQKQYVSSAGGAVAGAMIMGPLGAMIGGRVKEKTSRTIRDTFLHIDYQDNDEIKHICFNTNYATTPAFKLVQEFQKNNKKNSTTNIKNTKIEL